MLQKYYLYVFVFTAMSQVPQIDPQTLRAMGIELTGYEVPIPLYCRRRAVPYTEVGLPLYRSQPLPLSLQYLVSIVLQIGDPARFKRYLAVGFVFMKKRKKNEL